MIQLYAKGTTDFSVRGITLAALKGSVTFQDNGRFDLDVTVPVQENISFDYGMILRASVPEQHVPAITLGTVSYYTVTASAGSTLWSAVPTLKRVRYKEWTALRVEKVYAVGDKVSYLDQNYRMIALDPGSEMNYNSPPNNYPEYWEEISNYSGQPGKAAAQLTSGTTLMKTANFNSEYMEAATLDGKTGYIKIADVTATGETETRVIPAQTITAQSFEITEIEKSLDGKQITLHAEHVSYGLGRCVLGDCSLVGVNPATALLFIQGAMKEEYAGGLYTNLTEETITADWSWKNAQSAILDPKAGLLQFTAGQLIRNDRDVYLISKGEPVPKYQVTYGTNLRGVTWDGGITDMVTRVYPTAQAEDGRTILLPEEHIDTVRVVPFIRPEVLNTGLKVGTKEKQSDGTEIELTESIVYDRMREAANNRFNVDECDKADIRLEVDWIHLPDTEEYKEYAALVNAAPGEWVTVKAGPMGISETIQLTGYTWDAVMDRYEKATFGKNKVSSGVASYDLQTGAVTGRALAAGSVSGQNLQANSITAREIEAGSVTADKIASRSIQTQLLAAEAITANEIAAGAVTASKIATHEITADQIDANSVRAAVIGAGLIQAQDIDANSVRAAIISAGKISASDINALSVRTAILEAGKITANDIEAGAITAAKIDTTDLQALQATLQIANIANAQIASADIGYAQVKELNAQSAFFGQAVIQNGLANKLYVPRLSVGYAQMIGATVGDLVIQASNGNFYAIDVDLAGNVTATQRNVSQSEIESGHTTDGRQLVLGTDILAENLDTNNLTASHALMYSITANIIDVDQLWAREAFINKLMVQDISSNTYIQSVVGDWRSQSTITQEINSISSRISQLGYGTIFYSETEPDHNHLVPGDIWIEPISDNTWNDISEYTWDELASMSWEQVAGKYRMYVWTGDKFKILYDNLIVTELQTEINQTAHAVTLKADLSTVNTLSGQVSDFSAVLEVQAQAITAAVESVTMKASNYRQLNDPAQDPEVELHEGDIWTKALGNGLWSGVAEYTWDELSNYTWDEIAGASMYVWSGTEWIQISDYGAMIQNRTLIEQTDKQISLLAVQTDTLGDRVSENKAQIIVQADRITQEVERATNAENGKISKTSQYQTADAIVTEAVSQAASAASGTYLQKTTQYQTAQAIVSEAVSQAASAASGAYLAKTQTYQTAESIKSEAVRVSGQNADLKYLAQSTDYKNVAQIIAKSQEQANNAATSAKNASIAKTETYQSAEAIVNTAVAAIDNVPIFNTSSAYNVGAVVVYNGAMYKFTAYHAPGTWNPSQAVKIGVGSSYIAQTNKYQTADQIVSEANSYVDGQLASYSTITQTSEAISAYVTNHAYGIQSGIDITAEGIDISGSKHVIIQSGSLFKVSSSGFGVDSTNANYVIWAGASAAANAPFRVAPNGRVYLTKLMIVDEQGQNPQEFNLSTNMWKLWYETIRSSTITTDSSGNCTSFQLSNGTTVNFKSAASVDFASETLWISGSKTFTLTNGKTKTVNIPDALDWQATYVPNGQMSVSALIGGKAISSGAMEDPGYSRGESAGRASVDFASEGLWISGNKTLTLTNSKTKTVSIPNATDWSATYTTNGKMSVSAIVGGKAISSGEITDPGYTRGWDIGYAYANSEYTNLGNPGQLYVKNGNTYTAWQYPMTIYTK